ncbi:unnamed protein product [Jaminaea pallidilutea]
MRIHLNLAPPHRAGHDKGAGSSSSSSSAPAPLLALSPEGELVLIELQGSLEMENISAANGDGGEGQTIGELIWGSRAEDRPTLLLSHHRLEGKLVNLAKPLAVLEKRQRVGDGQAENDEGDGDANEEGEEGATATNGSRQETLGEPDWEETQGRVLASGKMASSSKVRGANGSGRQLAGPDEDVRSSPAGPADSMDTRKRGGLDVVADSEDEEEDEDPTASPSALRKRKAGQQRERDNGDLKAPSKRPREDAAQVAVKERFRSSPPVASSSPMPAPPLPGSAADYSSPPATPLAARSQARREGKGLSGGQGGSEDEVDQTTPTGKSALQPRGEDIIETPTTMLGKRSKETSTYYDVVCVVRKKILFNKRPEPVVHAAGSRGVVPR